MGHKIDKITLKGFKSIKELVDFPLTNLNILIGANGAGKSNFVSFFTFLRYAVEGWLDTYMAKKGRADHHLFMGPKFTQQIDAYLHFGMNGYEFHLQPTFDNRFVYTDERILYDGMQQGPTPVNRSIGTGHSESVLKRQLGDPMNASISSYVYGSISGWVVYHFHDTSDSSPMRRLWSVRDNAYLRPNADNLAAFLLRLRDHYPRVYASIKDTVRLAAPFFEDFMLRPVQANGDMEVHLEWTQKGSDYPFHVNQMSDGTLRFIALTTALLQPNPPATILLDEPELGLHPYALNLLAGLLKEAATRTQVIVSTQSAPLLDNFEAEDIIVVERKDGTSMFERLSSDRLQAWLKDYSLGELWQKNMIGGRPRNG